MRKKSEQFFSLLIITLLLGSLISSSAMAKGDRPVRLDSRGTFQTEAGIQSTTEMTLQESTDQSVWTDVYGNATTGYTMILDPANQYEYLDVSSITPEPADGDYPFVLDPVRVPAGFYEYWALKGVVETATAGTWQAYMWEIINGDLPMFYLRVSGTSYDLIDGLMYAMAADPNLVTDKLKVNGDYPLHTYNFEGTIGTETFVIGITFTRAVTPSLRIDGTEIETLVIDGCGYVDVTIHLENVYNLYAVDLSLTFDPLYVEVVDRLTDEIANPGINLLPIAPWDNPTTAYTVKNIAYNEDEPGTPSVDEAGTIRFIASLLNTQAPITGGLDVATIRLRAKALGESMLSITGMELSDRDGYLVGVPLTTAISYPVTTQFTADGGLDLGIIRLDNAKVRLSWPKQAMDAGVEYNLYRSTLPYFGITDPEVVEMNDTYFVENMDTVTFDDQVLGRVGPENPEEPEPDNNYFYAYGLQIVCSNEFTSPLSDQVGKIEYELWETATNDFNWIGLVLDVDPDWTSASALAQHIQNNSINANGYPVSVRVVSQWDPIGQTFGSYSTIPFPSGNFSVFLKSAYRIVINVSPNSTIEQASIIWAQVGRLPVIEPDTYTLYETATTSFNWILQPLDKTEINTASGLASDIVNNSSGTVLINSVSKWDPIGQSFANYSTIPFPSGNFATRFGYPYRITIRVNSGSSVTYPRYD